MDTLFVHRSVFYQHVCCLLTGMAYIQLKWSEIFIKFSRLWARTVRCSRSLIKFTLCQRFLPTSLSIIVWETTWGKYFTYISTPTSMYSYESYFDFYPFIYQFIDIIRPLIWLTSRCIQEIFSRFLCLRKELNNSYLI